MTAVTQILSRIESGESGAADRLLPLVYAELRRLSAQHLRREPSGQTLQPTALVHEAYLRLIGGAPDQPWNSRGHFFAAAAEAMRRILIERARRRQRRKHGGDRRRVELESGCLVDGPRSIDLLALDEALAKLALEQPVKAELVKLRYFAGFSTTEAAQLLDISVATAERYWAFARGWLYAELADQSTDPIA